MPGSQVKVPVVVALGANVGDPRATLRITRTALESRLPPLGAQGLRFSRLWSTAPVGPPQPRYLNAACTFEAPPSLTAPQILTLLQALESAAGRVRSQRWGPRTLDLDLICVGAVRCNTPRLTLPHPRAAQRAFVLWPLADVAPSLHLPGAGPVLALAQQCGRAGNFPVSDGDSW